MILNVAQFLHLLSQPFADLVERTLACHVDLAIVVDARTPSRIQRRPLPKKLPGSYLATDIRPFA